MDLLNRPSQTILAERTNAVSSPANFPGGAPDQTFRESLQAQIGTPVVVDTDPELPPTGAGVTGPLPSAANTPNRVDPNQPFAQGITNSAEPGETSLSKFKANTRVSLAVQKQMPVARGHGATNRIASGRTENSDPVESTDTKAVNADVVLLAIAPQISVQAVVSPAQQPPEVPVPVVPFNLPKNNSSVSVGSIPQASVYAVAPSMTDTGATTKRETPLSAMTDSSRTIHSTVGRNDRPDANQQAIDTGSLRSETQRAYPDRKQLLEVSDIGPSPARLVDETAGNGAASSNLPFVGVNDESSLEGTTQAGNELNVVTVQLRSTGETQDQVVAAPRIRKSENGKFAQSPPGPVAVDPAQNVNRPLPSTDSSRVSASTPTSESSRSSRSSSPRISSSGTRQQTSDVVFQNTSDVLATRSLDTARIVEVSHGGSTTPKITDAISSDTRLQDTFAALEPTIRNEGGTSNWARSGHVQAESGYQDPELGWIGVRAEAHAGGVHATLVPQSSDAAQALSGHIAGLHTYLAENRTHVETIVLASYGSNAQEFAGQGSEQGMPQGNGQDTGHGNPSQPELLPQSMVERTTSGAVHRESIADEVFIRGNRGADSRGVHISVLA